MLDCDAVYDALIELGVTSFTGVPDSLLAPLCACIAARATDHVIAANEGNALAIAVGHQVATGGLPLVYLQNSGLGNLVNPLLSLADPSVYGVPVVLLVGWRGRPGGPTDAVQHHAQGARTEALLEACGTPTHVLPAHLDGARSTLAAASRQARVERRPVAVLVPEKRLAPWVPVAAPRRGPLPGREAVIRALLDHIPPHAIVVSTTGKASRELFDARRSRGDGHGQDLLVVGSMGHASTIALGLARGRPGCDVWCLDGDGAALMHLGAMATIGAAAPTNLTHVLLNNGAHDSVGGQPTVGFDVDFCAIARACGYATVRRADSLPALPAAVQGVSGAGLGLLELRIATGARPDLPRPDVDPETRLAALRRTLAASPEPEP